MAKKEQIAGLLLEEALLSFLRVSGYEPVVRADPADDSLFQFGDTLKVRGRGADHQIDAIADYLRTPPFGNPYRLLLEAKMYSDKVQINTIRNAFGVLRDVSEFWLGDAAAGQPRGRRWHYQYAVFSSKGFSSNAQMYAFAHDIYLLSLADTGVMAPVLSSIRALSKELAKNDSGSGWTSELRRNARDAILYHREPDGLLAEYREQTDRLITACNHIETVLIGMVQSRFPIFLVPRDDMIMNRLLYGNDGIIPVRISRGNDHLWLIRNTDDEELFVFDLPEDLFKQYAESGLLTKGAVFDFKREVLNKIELVLANDGRFRVIALELDGDWLDRVRDGLSVKK